ncbi:LysR family transcriptional regulator [Pseudomonas gingeri]
MFEINDLRAFIRIADLKSVSAAAKSLGAPKSSVSRSMARLEHMAGAALVERSSRHLRLTDAGHLLYPQALRILENVEIAMSTMVDHAGVPSGVLRINAPCAFSRCIIAPMLPSFLKRYPSILVEIVATDERINMLSGEFDITIRIGTMADSLLVARRIRSTELWTCASPRYLSECGTPLTLKDLLNHNLIGRADRLLSWFAGDTASGKLTSDNLGRVSTLDSDIVEKILINDGGIGLLPDYLARSAVARGELVRLFTERPALSVEVYAVYADHHSLSTKVRVFIDALLSSIEQLDSPGIDFGQP